VVEPRLLQAAQRLGAFYQSLLAIGEDVGPTTLPVWAEPPRVRPGGWAVGSRASAALSPSYFPWLARGYEQSVQATDLRRRVYDEDLRILLTALRPALRVTTELLLNEQVAQLGALGRRFQRPGADDRLTPSARRVLGNARRLMQSSDPPSAGTPGPPPGPDQQPAVPPEQTTQPQPQTQDQPSGGSTTSEVLPGGTPGPVDPATPPPNITQRPTRVDRPRLLVAIALERRGLENGSVDPLDPRDAPRKAGGKSGGQSEVPAGGQSEVPAGGQSGDPAGDQSGGQAGGEAGPNAAEVSQLLAVLALHPRAQHLLELYESSPSGGSTAMAYEVERATAATRELLRRLTEGDTADDAWRYAPLVLAAVGRLGLSEVRAFPEFALALGTQLARTRTEAIMSAAGLLLLVLSIAFTGPVGAAVVGTLDLAFSGVGVGIAQLHQYERDLAADVSTFRAEDEQFVGPGGEGETALAVAGAFLAAVGLAGTVRPLLKVRPRAPRQLVTLELDESVRTFSTEAADVERAAARAGNRPSLVRRSPADAPPLELDPLHGRPSPTVDDVSRGLDPSTSGPSMWRSEADMQQRAASAAQQPGGRQVRTGNRSEGALRDFALTPEQAATADRGTVRDATQGAQQDVVPGAEPARGYGEVDVDAISLEVGNRPALEDLPRASGGKGRVLTSEGQAYDALWARDLHDPEVADWARRQLPEGSPDPLAPWITVGPKNPAVPDHMVPVERIRQFYGFAHLSGANQRRVLMLPENFMPVSKLVNESRGSKSFTEWLGPAGREIPAEVRAAMQAREVTLTQQIHDMIDTLLAEQNAVRGTTRPPSGAPGLGARLTGTALSGASAKQR